MTFLPALLTGVVLGALAISLHMKLLYSAIGKVAEAPDAISRGYIVKTAPVRVLLWVPILFIVARLGLIACLGALASMLVVRAVWVGRYLHEVS